MRDKAAWLQMLRDVYQNWTTFVDGLSAEQINTVFADDYALKQTLGHLWGWEQLTLARLEAAVEDRDLRFDLWPAPYEADSDEGTDAINVTIQRITHDMAWDRLYADWKMTFQRVIALTERISEADLMAKARYAWLDGNPLSDVIGGVVGHTQEHLIELQQRYGITVAPE